MMSNLPSPAEQEAHTFSRLGSGLGYFTVLIGYLFTILMTTHLTLPNFLVFTVLQVCYSILLWWMIQSVWQNARGWRIVLAAVLLMGITVLVGLLPLMGLQWDWLLFLVTTAIFFSLLPVRSGLGTGMLVYPC